MLVRAVSRLVLNRPQQKARLHPLQQQAVMAKAKLHQIKLTADSSTAQPPFPGGWVLAIFDALNNFAPTLAHEHRLPISKRTQERIKAKSALPVKQVSYDEIEIKLVEVITVLFPKVSSVNGFAQKYVDEYFRLWKIAAEIGPKWVASFGFKPGKPSVISRALVRDLVLRLCYLESCERKLNQQSFSKNELNYLGHDLPTQIYRLLISAATRQRKMSVEKLADFLKVTEKSLHRIKGGESLPSYKLLQDLKRSHTGDRMLAGLGFVDHLLKHLGLHKSILRHEFLAAASVFFRYHPPILEAFIGSITRKTEGGEIQNEECKFEGFIRYGDQLLVHPGFHELWTEMPDAIWRCHLHTLRFARNADLAQAYFQFAAKSDDEPLEDFLRAAEQESGDIQHYWMTKLRAQK
jgi:hypothetical protein